MTLGLCLAKRICPLMAEMSTEHLLYTRPGSSGWTWSTAQADSVSGLCNAARRQLVRAVSQKQSDRSGSRGWLSPEAVRERCPHEVTLEHPHKK